MFKPLEDRIILKVDAKEEKKTSSGLIIQTLNQEADKEATVVAVGPGRVLPSGIRLEPDVSVGDRVVFNHLATMKLEYEGEEYLSVYSKDILAIIGGTDGQ
jgi:chaperonin GroES